MPTQLRQQANRAARRRDAIGAGIRITLDGVAYTVHIGEVSALDSAALRRATGMSMAGLLKAIGPDPDIDIVAALVWLARRQDGETGLSYEEVAAAITYESEMATENLDAPDVAPDPVRVAEAGDAGPEA